MRFSRDYRKRVFVKAKKVYLYSTINLPNSGRYVRKKCKASYSNVRLIDAMFPIMVDKEIFMTKLNHDLSRIYRTLSAIRGFCWYNTDNDLVAVMVAAMALLDTDPHHKELKKIVHDYRVESKKEFDSTRLYEYMKHYTKGARYYPYSFILQESVLKWLFKEPKLRILLLTLLDVYRHEKRLKGSEIKERSIVEATNVQHVIQLLKGYVVEDTDFRNDGKPGLMLMKVPAYNRYAKDELSYLEWKKALINYQSVLNIDSLWD